METKTNHLSEKTANTLAKANNLWLRIFILAILAGAAISLGCVVFLVVGGPLGAVLFSFGLLTCITFKLQLYTGQAGFIGSLSELPKLGLILLGNIIGCGLMSLVIRVTHPMIIPLAIDITVLRTGAGVARIFFLAFLCGTIMTVAVKNARESHYWTLLLGIPMFILTGMVHSIADAFYILLSGQFTWDVLLVYISAVLGNFFGCNLFRPSWIKALLPAAKVEKKD